MKVNKSASWKVGDRLVLCNYGLEGGQYCAPIGAECVITKIDANDKYVYVCWINREKWGNLLQKDGGYFKTMFRWVLDELLDSKRRDNGDLGDTLIDWKLAKDVRI